MINFNSVIMHNFGSYNHAEIDLRNKGFCLVSGENHRKEDNALSNGSGKSMCWSAICFALTGETIQGIKSGLKNIYNDEPDAYVILDFDVDGDHFSVKRILAPHSDLKIEKNSQDVSGKGIREGEAKLTELLPDLNSDLLTSSILIGQGMPNKFSSFKPSGRKEILEKLTKSDFMIADMKARIESRKDVLSTQIKETSDKQLISKTKAASLEGQLNVLKAKQTGAQKPDFRSQIDLAIAKLKAKEAATDVMTQDIAESEVRISSINSELLAVTQAKAGRKTELLESYNQKTAGMKTEKASVETELRLANSALMKIKAHPEICPTCGQKMPNSNHLKAEKQEKESIIKTLNEKLSVLKKDIETADIAKAKYASDIDHEFDNKIKELQESLSKAKSSLSVQKSNLAVVNLEQIALKDEIKELTMREASWDREQTELKNTIEQAEKDLSSLQYEQKDIEEALANLNEHLAVVKQLETLTKRDFRGYILSDVIKYVDEKAKDFSEIIFKHRDLNIYLDGNDLDISYNGKMLDNLSGGERQRVDLITQFAIRDLLVNHLNMGSNILVLDEITDFLDKTSCDAVMNLVEKELNSVESVFIVSHHAESLGIAVDSELKVIKDESGISSILIN